VSTNYLAGQRAGLTIVPGDLAAGINPTQNEDVSPVEYGELRGGDVSSRDSVGIQDNAVELEDIIYIQNNFNQDTTVVGNRDIGDVNGNGRVEFGDLLVAAGNFNEEGVPPVFTKPAAKDNAGAKVRLQGIPDRVIAGQQFEVEVWAQNVADLRGYEMTLRIDPAELRLVNGPDVLTEGQFLRSADPGASTIFFTQEDRKGTILVNALLGNRQTATGDGELLRVKLEAVRDVEHPAIALDDVKLGNSAGVVTTVGQVALVPQEFGLQQNYPNPFNPETSIRFQLPEDSHVSLKIFNMLGQEVRTLASEPLTAGFYNLRWDGRNAAGLRVASGVYIYQIRAGDFVASRKMLLLK
jgi:hypothetical protein